jgi:predicted secreted protein
MSLLSSVAVFFVIWWLCLFVVLPWGVRSQDEVQNIAPGTERGAPHQPHLLRRAVATTLLASVIFAAVYVYFGVLGLRIDDLTP